MGLSVNNRAGCLNQGRDESKNQIGFCIHAVVLGRIKIMNRHLDFTISVVSGKMVCLLAIYIEIVFKPLGVVVANT